jgi:putative two-component system response regulator
MRILIVDDNVMSLDILAASLEASGHEVERATDGHEGLDRILEGDIRLVISDWEMPGMTGEELCQAVRSAGLPAYVYFILLTSHADSEHIVRGLAAGADDFVSKPFNPDELTVRVRAGERVLALETRDLAMFAMAKLAESRDPETGAHLERIQEYSRVLTAHLLARGDFSGDVTSETPHLIHAACPLHDIGKVGIPDSVLLKPGRLNDREFELMKTHTLIGARTIDAALQQYPDAQFLEIARDIAASHHERFDGSGYPLGLAGEEIPLAGRIVALADVYDALTSRRAYKDVLSHEVARSMIQQDAGAHFDPVVVEAFISAEDQFVAIREAFSQAEEMIGV